MSIAIVALLAPLMAVVFYFAVMFLFTIFVEFLTWIFD